jgi:Abnormal spindle-like microcephaly-assoc'd, ASPM-SPD-2-Hydin
MKYLLHALVFVTLCTILGFAVPSPAQRTAPQAEPTGSARSFRWPAPTSNGATFINPKDGQIVHPGETIPIDLVVDAGITPVKAVAIVSRMGDSNEFREGPPYSFTFRVPDKNLSGPTHRLIGFQGLTLFGTVVGRRNYSHATITVDVEEPDLPVTMFAIDSSLSPRRNPINHLDFHDAGKYEEIDIYATFPNGHKLDVTESTYLSLSSENPAVAIVADDGTVASVGGGKTRIIATYSQGTQQKLLDVWVTVETMHRGVDVSPATVNFGDVISNAESRAIEITITNRWGEDVHLSKLQPAPAFSVRSENCSKITLPPNGSCSITVTFTPMRPGSYHGNIYLGDSHSGIFSIPIFGKGT